MPRDICPRCPATSQSAPGRNRTCAPGLGNGCPIAKVNQIKTRASAKEHSPAAPCLTPVLMCPALLQNRDNRPIRRLCSE